MDFGKLKVSRKVLMKPSSLLAFNHQLTSRNIKSTGCQYGSTVKLIWASAAHHSGYLDVIRYTKSPLGLRSPSVTPVYVSLHSYAGLANLHDDFLLKKLSQVPRQEDLSPYAEDNLLLYRNFSTIYLLIASKRYSKLHSSFSVVEKSWKMQPLRKNKKVPSQHSVFFISSSRTTTTTSFLRPLPFI